MELSLSAQPTIATTFNPALSTLTLTVSAKATMKDSDVRPYFDIGVFVKDSSLQGHDPKRDSWVPFTLLGCEGDKQAENTFNGE